MAVQVLFKKYHRILNLSPWFWPFVVEQIRTFWFGNFYAISEHPPILPECKQILRQLLDLSHPGGLPVTSMIVAAVIWHADEPSSVKTTWAPESSFTMHPRSTTLLLYFCYFGSNSAFSRWHVSISDAKWTIFFVSLCVQNNFLIALDFLQIPCVTCLELLPFFVHSRFGVGNLHRLSSTFTDERTFIQSQTDFSPVQVLTKLFRIVFPTTIRLVDGRTSFVQEAPWLVSWKTHPNVGSFCLENFEQSGSVLPCHLSVSWHCVGCLSVTTW